MNITLEQVLHSYISLKNMWVQKGINGILSVDWNGFFPYSWTSGRHKHEEVKYTHILQATSFFPSFYHEISPLKYIYCDGKIDYFL